MTRKLVMKLRQKDGISYPFVACLTLALLVIAFGVFEIIRMNIIAANVRDKFQAVIVSETTRNFSNMYQPVRDGYAASFQNNGSGWQVNSITTRNRVLNTLNTHFNTSEHSQVTIHSVDFAVDMVTSAPVGGSPTVQYNLSGELIISVPYKFLWANLPPIQMTVNVHSTWREMF